MSQNVWATIMPFGPVTLIIVYPFIVDHYCLSFYCQPLLFILALPTIIVYPFIADHYCLSFHCRPLLFILFLAQMKG
jgi:hypothetical protein